MQSTPPIDAVLSSIAKAEHLLVTAHARPDGDAIGGVLAAPMRTVNPEMESLVLAEAFVVPVIGGMGPLVGSVVAGLVVGIAVSMTALFAPEMAQIVMFALMALVLLVRPKGLFGKVGAHA